MRAANFSFYVLIYFFLLINSLLGAPFKPVKFTIGIDRNIKVDDVSYEEVRMAVRDACQEWNNTGIVVFAYNPYPQIEVTSRILKPDRVAQFDIYNGCVEINRAIYPHINYRPWNRQLLTRVLIHELGHAMGMREHSDSPNDIMYPIITDVNKPSANDVKRLKGILYR